ncbi:MAG: hypothetical protein WCP12_01225 [bacterium]
MRNRWSDAARAAALAVRQKRAFAANPQAKPKPVVAKGGLAKKPFPTAPSSTPKPNVYIPPNGGVGTQYAEGMKVLPKPNIFYSSTYPNGPGQSGIRYDPANPNTGEGKGPQPMPPKPPPVKPPPVKPGWPRDRGVGGELLIGKSAPTVFINGKRYTRVGNKLVPFVVVPYSYT